MRGSKAKFVIVLSVLLIAGFLATSLISYFVARGSLTDQIAESTLPLTSDTIYSEIQQDLLKPIFISSLMARDTFVRDWVLAGEQDRSRIERYLGVIQDRYDTFTAFFISDKTRAYYHPSGKDRTVDEANPEDAWYFHARALTEDYEINVDSDKMNQGILTVFINHRVYDFDGNFIGVTGVGLAVDTMRNLMASYARRYGRRVYFADREGDIKLHSANYNGPANIRDSKGLGPYATQILTSPSGAYTYQSNGRTVFLNSRLVPEFGWYLLVEQDENLAEQPILHTLIGNLLASVAITLVVMTLAYLTLGGYQSRLEEMATVDHLTRAVNRQAFDLMYHQAVSAANRRDDSDLSLIMLDIDHFKAVNDSHGHVAGDVVLQAVADTVRGHVRQGDVLCRWGGEEFLVMLTECNEQAARAIAEKIRIAVGMRQVHFGSTTLSVTVSAGVSQYQPSDTEDSLVRRVDRALYDAKEGGRNRVEVAPI